MDEDKRESIAGRSLADAIHSVLPRAVEEHHREESGRVRPQCVGNQRKNPIQNVAVVPSACSADNPHIGWRHCPQCVHLPALQCVRVANEHLRHERLHLRIIANDSDMREIGPCRAAPNILPYVIGTATSADEDIAGVIAIPQADTGLVQVQAEERLVCRAAARVVIEPAPRDDSIGDKKNTI